MDEHNWRYERKFSIEDISINILERMLRRHPAGFREIYHRRWVNNIYLDGPAMSSLTDNVIGVSERLKTRIRWYGDFLGPIARPTLERKFKRGIVGRKESYLLGAWHLSDGFAAAEVRVRCEVSPLPEPVRVAVKPLKAILANRYSRRYFQSADGRFRFTLDSDVTSHPVRPFDNRLMQWRRHPDVVVELKYVAADDFDAHTITSQLPLRLSRSSKYVTGLDTVHALGVR